MNTRLDRKREVELIDQVDSLNDEVKILALNLAIYLAKAKVKSEQLTRLEPDFIRLVNGTVKVVQELATVINAARNLETISYDIPSSRIPGGQIEVRLRSILDQCGRIMCSLGRMGKSGH